jgi:hypothetical protein
MHVVERFADWAVQYRAQPLAPEVLHHAKLFSAADSALAALAPGLRARKSASSPSPRISVTSPPAPRTASKKSEK